MVQNKSVIETIMGALVLAAAAGFVLIAYKSGNISTSQGYEVVAKFQQVDGLSVGSDVRVGGIKVGTVTKQELDTTTGLYQAQITLHIDKNVQLPRDTSAAIVSSGLLGSKYIALDPGADDAMLKPGDNISQTQSSINIEALIGKFMFGGTDSSGGTTKPNNTSDKTDSSNSLTPGL